MTLFRQQFRTQLTGMLIWAAALMALTLLLTATAGSLSDAGALPDMLAKLPSAMQNMLGIFTGLSAADVYIALKAAPTAGLLVVMYAVLLGLSIITREIDRRTMDFLLALPVERGQVLLSRVAVLAVNTGILCAASWLVIWADFASQGHDASFGVYALIFVAYWLLGMAFGGLTLLTSIWIDDYSFGVKLWLSLVSVAFVLEYVLRAAGLERWQRALSPFSYVDPVEILRQGTLPWADILVMIAVAAITIGLSVPLFQRKQIAA